MAKSKLTQALIDEAVTLLEAGNYVNTVCDAIGVSEGIWYRWIKEAEDPKAAPLKVEFVESIKRATSEAERSYVGVIQDAAKQHWQAAAWWLERKMPEKWGRHDRLKVDATVNSGVMVVPEDKQAKEWERLAKEQRAFLESGNGRPN